MTDATNKSLVIFQHAADSKLVDWIAQERYEREIILEASVDIIIEKDLDKLISFFDTINKHRFENKTDTELKPFQFLAIKAITKRAMDVDTIIKLLNLTNNERLDKREVAELPIPKKTHTQFNSTLMLYDITIRNRFVHINTKVKIHAALRRLEMIGELLWILKNTTRTNLSNNILRSRSKLQMLLLRFVSTSFLF